MVWILDQHVRPICDSRLLAIPPDLSVFTYAFHLPLLQAHRYRRPPRFVDGGIWSSARCSIHPQDDAVGSIIQILSVLSHSDRLCRLAKSKSHIIYNDAGLNSTHAVYLNIYQNFTVLAMKMHSYLREWRLNVAKSHAFVLGMSSSAMQIS